MNISFLRNKTVTVTVSVLVLLAIVAGVYFLIVSPKLEDVKQKEQELSAQEKILSVLQNKITGTKSSTFESTVALQQSVPVKPLSEQLLLDIEKAETISGSFVVNMDFQEADMEENQDQQKSDSTNEKQDQTNQATTEEEQSKENTIPLPTGVKKLTVNLNIESPSYFELEKFLQILEASTRIVVVEAIDFSANDEIISTDQTNKPLTYKVTLSAFYMPGLTDLINQLPKIDAPAPSNKKNPLIDFGDYNSSEIESNVDDSVTNSDDNNTNNNNQNNENNNTEEKPDTTTDTPNHNNNESANDTNTNENIKILKYTVKKGDTLTKIAMEFFHSKDGVKIIMDANHLKNESVTVGQVLLIPLQI